MTYFESRFMASIVRTSRERWEPISAMICSTRTLSYPIWTKDDARRVSVVFFCWGWEDFLEKSIDHLRSTIIFWAVFLPIPGTDESKTSSSNWIALRSVSHQSPRRLRAVFPPIPFTRRSCRNMLFSSWSKNPKSVSPASLIWWWSHISIFFSFVIFASRSGEAKISSHNQVPSTRHVICIHSTAMIFPYIKANIRNS